MHLQVEKECLQELLQMDSVVKAAQPQNTPEFEEWKVRELTLELIQEGKGESEIDTDNRNLPGNHYPRSS